MQFELFPWVYIVCYIELYGMKRIFLFHGGMKKKNFITLYNEKCNEVFFSYLHETKKFSSFLKYMYMHFIKTIYLSTNVT